MSKRTFSPVTSFTNAEVLWHFKAEYNALWTGTGTCQELPQFLTKYKELIHFIKECTIEGYGQRFHLRCIISLNAKNHFFSSHWFFFCGMQYFVKKLLFYHGWSTLTKFGSIFIHIMSAKNIRLFVVHITHLLNIYPNSLQEIGWSSEN